MCTKKHQQNGILLIVSPIALITLQLQWKILPIIMLIILRKWHVYCQSPHHLIVTLTSLKLLTFGITKVNFASALT